MNPDKIKEIETMFNIKSKKYTIFNNREIEFVQEGFDYNIMDEYFPDFFGILNYINNEYINISEVRLPRIFIKTKLYNDFNMPISGRFEARKFNDLDIMDVVIVGGLSEESFLYLLCHELGHWIHYVIYNDEYIKWHEEELSEYGLTDNKEAFAEVIVDLFNGVNNKNTRKMKRMFNKIDKEKRD